MRPMDVVLCAVGLAVWVTWLAGCMSPYKVTDEFQNAKKTLVVITKDTEMKSPFGTNGGADIYELCESPEKKVFFYLSGDFTNCVVLKADHPLYALLHHKQSQGQGGQIVEGLAGAGGMGAIAATRAGGNAAATVLQSTTVVGGHRRH